MSWSLRRKIVYLSVFFAILVIFFSVLYYFFIHKAPTCKDKIQNQNEQGIDCGGVCPKVCEFEIVNPVVRWTKLLKVKKGIYNVVAFVENPNLKARAVNAPYLFKVYDKNRILIGERKGKINLPARSFIPIFERTIFVGEREPSRSPLFEFTESFQWEKVEEKKLDLSVKNKILEEKNGGTRLSAVIGNQSVLPISNIEVTGILYDVDGNAIAVSQTIIESLLKNASEKVVFTWTESLLKKTSKTEIITVSQD